MTYLERLKARRVEYEKLRNQHQMNMAAMEGAIYAIDREIADEEKPAEEQPAEDAT